MAPAAKLTKEPECQHASCPTVTMAGAVVGVSDSYRQSPFRDTRAPNFGLSLMRNIVDGAPGQNSD